MGGRLEGRVALIFGAGSSAPGLSIGRAISLLFAMEGARIVAVDRDLESATDTVNEIRQLGFDAVGVKADVTRTEDVQAAVTRCASLYGRIDVLVNNVAITRLARVAEMDEPDWDSVLSTNLKSVYRTCRFVLPYMLAQKSGSIVNVSSLGSIRTSPAPLASYAVSKAGVNQLTSVIAVEYAAYGIRANAILPGLIDTPMARSQMLGHYGSAEDLMATRNARSPTGKLGEPMDVAHAALFLASDEARYVNGVLLPVDGGLAAKMA